jgi:hypothetical protein
MMVETNRNKLMKESQAEAARAEATRRLFKEIKENKDHPINKQLASIKLDYGYRIADCPKCGRAILVQYGLFGIDHTTGICVICKDCLKKIGISEEFTKEHPEEAKEISDWLSKP